MLRHRYSVGGESGLSFLSRVTPFPGPCKYEGPVPSRPGLSLLEHSIAGLVGGEAVIIAAPPLVLSRPLLTHRASRFWNIHEPQGFPGGQLPTSRLPREPTVGRGVRARSGNRVVEISYIYSSACGRVGE